MTEEIKQVNSNWACACVGVPLSYAHPDSFLGFFGQESRFFCLPIYPLVNRKAVSIRGAAFFVSKTITYLLVGMMAEPEKFCL